MAFDSDRNGSWWLLVINTDGTNILQLTEDGKYPHWSLDGQHMFFVSERDGGKGIYVMNADGGNLHRLTCNPASQRKH